MTPRSAELDAPYRAAFRELSVPGLFPALRHRNRLLPHPGLVPGRPEELHFGPGPAKHKQLWPLRVRRKMRSMQEIATAQQITSSHSSIAVRLIGSTADIFTFKSALRIAIKRKHEKIWARKFRSPTPILRRGPISLEARVILGARQIRQNRPPQSQDGH